MAIGGSLVSMNNIRFRFFLIIFCGVMLFGTALYWREQTLLTAEYTEFPQVASVKTVKSGEVLRSENYQIETEDVSPVIK